MKNLTITLIQKDLQHHQHIANFANRPEVGKEHCQFEILEIVQELMDVPDSAEFVFGKTYYNYMGLAASFPLNASSENIRNQAKLCYSHLEGIVELEREHLPKT